LRGPVGAFARDDGEKLAPFYFGASLAAGTSFAGGRGGLLLIISRLLLRCLQILHGLLQPGNGAFQDLDLPVRGIELLLMVGADFCNCLLQEIDVALQATGPPFHGLFDGADSMPGTSCARASADVSSVAAKAVGTTRASRPIMKILI
jgi:hypothetical protein